MCALVFQLDQTVDAGQIWLLSIVDEFTREALVMHVVRSINAGQTTGLLEWPAAAHSHRSGARLSMETRVVPESGAGLGGRRVVMEAFWKRLLRQAAAGLTLADSPQPSAPGLRSGA